MTLRKLAAAPLAGSVAVVAHVAGFGFDHAPGGPAAPGLLAGLGSALILAVLGLFFAAALGGERDAIATPLRLRKGVAGLAAAGFAGYALIELVEGHFSLGGGLRALAATLPAGALLALLAHVAARAVARAGRRFAAYACAARSRRPSGFRRRFTAAAAAAAAAMPAGSRRGRAPPQAA